MVRIQPLAFPGESAAWAVGPGPRRAENGSLQRLLWRRKVPENLHGRPAGMCCTADWQQAGNRPTGEHDGLTGECGAIRVEQTGFFPFFATAFIFGGGEQGERDCQQRRERGRQEIQRKKVAILQGFLLN